MGEFERLMRLKEEMRRRMPEFVRFDWWRFRKFKNQWAWRKPKGNDNKMRLKLKGWPAVVSVGYRKPRHVRGLHPSGLEPVVVSDPEQLEKLAPSRHIVYIASGVGTRKRAQILAKARELGFKVANRR